TIHGRRRVFVVLLRCAIGKACDPFWRQSWELRTSPRLLAAFVSYIGQKTIHNFHSVTGEIWKQRVPGDRAARPKRESKRWLTAPERSNDFPRCAISVH